MGTSLVKSGTAKQRHRRSLKATQKLIAADDGDVRIDGRYQAGRRVVLGTSDRNQAWKPLR